MMKDQFYVVLPSNSSMHYFSENTTTRFVTQLPQPIRLQGVWNVALVEVQIPLMFQHIPIEEAERCVNVERVPQSPLITNLMSVGEKSSILSMVRPGIYITIESLVEEINSLECMKKHLEMNVRRGGYISVSRECQNTSCSAFDHVLGLSKRLKRILGFDEQEDGFGIFKQDTVVGHRPANLSSG